MPHRSHDISNLVVFGDSLSDNGNLFSLIGIGLPFSWQGRASNGPVYAEQLAAWLGVPLNDHAYGAAEASDASPPVLINPATGKPFPINLPEQVAGYLAELNDSPPAHGTTALINIGGNDYVAFLRAAAAGLVLPTPQTIHAFVDGVVASIADAIDTLTQAGIEKIVLFTLPDLGLSLDAQAGGPLAVELAHAVAAANNAALEKIAASHPNVEVVDVFQASEALYADAQSFGFIAPLHVSWVGLQLAHSTQFAPNEVASFDGGHPTTAAHGILAAFTEATLKSDHVQFLDGTQSVVHALPGDNFIFATPIDPTTPGLTDDYTIYGGTGRDLIFAGSGNVTVHGGAGTELIAAGSGNATLTGGGGTDLLETNSKGTSYLAGGVGGDALIVNRGGTNVVLGGAGNDLIVLKENAGLVGSGGSFKFGHQEINGGAGLDTLRFIINDQHPAAESALIAEFQAVVAAFDLAVKHHHAGTFSVDGLDVSAIERIELQVDSVSTDPNTPYLITNHIALADGHAAPLSAVLGSLLKTADHWNLLAV
jgi:phospholipase/lecithinase/hemolysin